jgi:putative NADH-flavin reductase
MNILVFGASGATGRHLVPQALSLGHHVTAFVRNPSAIANNGQQLRVVKGDVLDPTSVAAAMPGQDAVVCALGTGRRERTALSTGVANILQAMKSRGVRRLVFLSGLGAGDSKTQTALVGRLVQALLLKEMYEDKGRQESLIKQSDLDWTIVRPPLLRERPAKGKLRVSLDGRKVGWRITRADLAAFMLAQLTSEEFVRRAPAVSN